MFIYTMFKLQILFILLLYTKEKNHSDQVVVFGTEYTIPLHCFYSKKAYFSLLLWVKTILKLTHFKYFY